MHYIIIIIIIHNNDDDNYAIMMMSFQYSPKCAIRLKIWNGCLKIHAASIYSFWLSLALFPGPNYFQVFNAIMLIVII